LEGELVNPGIYPVEPGETLRQLVARIGGVTPQGYLYGAEFTRESTRIQQQKKLDEYLERLERDLERAITQLSQSTTSAEQAANMQSQVQSQRSLLEKLKRAKATGRVVLEVPPGSNRIADLPDMALEDGDRLLVPPKPSTISVVGSVYSENAFIYRPEKRVTDYLGQAGGPTPDGDDSSIYVLRADGSVISKRQSGWVSLGGFGGETVLPGDAIIVPEKFDKSTTAKNLKDWTQILYQFALGVAGLKVLKD
jgi:polysaccharide export outer membrane protein